MISAVFNICVCVRVCVSVYVPVCESVNLFVKVSEITWESGR